MGGACRVFFFPVESSYLYFFDWFHYTHTEKGTFHHSAFCCVACLSFSFPVSDDGLLSLAKPYDDGVPGKEGEQAAPAVYSLAKRCLGSHPRHSPCTSTSMVRGRSSAGGAYWLPEQNKNCQNLAAWHRSAHCATWRWVSGVAASTLLEARPHRHKHLSSCVRSESGCDRNLDVMWNLVSRQKAFGNTVQIAADAPELQLNRVCDSSIGDV